MTSVTLNELNSGIYFECVGHAGAGEKGKDIVCAGISALILALTERIIDLDMEHLITVNSFHLADGEYSVEVEWQDGFGREAAHGAFDTAAAGLTRIAEMYPENVVCNF